MRCPVAGTVPTTSSAWAAPSVGELEDPPKSEQPGKLEASQLESLTPRQEAPQPAAESIDLRRGHYGLVAIVRTE